MKGALSQDTARLMVFKLLDGVHPGPAGDCKNKNQLPKVINGVMFRDGIEVAPAMKFAA